MSAVSSAATASCNLQCDGAIPHELRHNRGVRLSSRSFAVRGAFGSKLADGTLDYSVGTVFQARTPVTSRSRCRLLSVHASNHHLPHASLLPPPSCVGGIRRAIAVPNAGGREWLIFTDLSPAATRRNRCSPERATARREVEAAQRASHV